VVQAGESTASSASWRWRAKWRVASAVFLPRPKMMVVNAGVNFPSCAEVKMGSIPSALTMGSTMQLNSALLTGACALRARQASSAK